MPLAFSYKGKITVAQKIRSRLGKWREHLPHGLFLSHVQEGPSV